MKNVKKELIKLWQIFIKELNNLKDEEIDLLLNGEAKLELIVKSKSKRKSLLSDIDFTKLENELRGLSSREEGLALLEKNLSSKEEYEKFTRILDLPVLRGDKVDLIKKKIIEATIGYKLRSDSIQNK